MRSYEVLNIVAHTKVTKKCEPSLLISLRFSLLIFQMGTLLQASLIKSPMKSSWCRRSSWILILFLSPLTNPFPFCFPSAPAIYSIRLENWPKYVVIAFSGPDHSGFLFITIRWTVQNTKRQMFKCAVVSFYTQCPEHSAHSHVASIHMSERRTLLSKAWALKTGRKTGARSSPGLSPSTEILGHLFQ